MFVRALQNPPALLCLLQEVETGAMAEADSIPEAEAITAPETTIIAGKGLATAGGLPARRLRDTDTSGLREESSRCKARACFPQQESRWLRRQVFRRVLQRQLRQLR